MKTPNYENLAKSIKEWGQLLGFQQVGISDIDLVEAGNKLKTWLKNNYHGEMHYMSLHGSKRFHPEELVPGTLRIISCRMDYLPPNANRKIILKDANKAYIANYALGRDYHKLIRKRLKQLANKIKETNRELNYRVFADSAPILEKPLATKAGLGWQGKHTLVLNKKAGSWFFLGEILTNLPLPIDKPVHNECGTCQACLNICPTKAIFAPYQLDARRCISYLTIEYKGSIPVELRSLMGNRIFGCDDCQLICPWNRFAKSTQEKDFHPRHGLDGANLITLFAWTEEEFSKKTEGSAIRRATYFGWLRNIAIALGNAPHSQEIISALKQQKDHPSELVREHVIWALKQQEA